MSNCLRLLNNCETGSWKFWKCIMQWFIQSTRNLIRRYNKCAHELIDTRQCHEPFYKTNTYTCLIFITLLYFWFLCKICYKNANIIIWDAPRKCLIAWFSVYLNNSPILLSCNRRCWVYWAHINKKLSSAILSRKF